MTMVIPNTPNNFIIRVHSETALGVGRYMNGEIFHFAGAMGRALSARVCVGPFDIASRTPMSILPSWNG
jgi:hypothetical protein